MEFWRGNTTIGNYDMQFTLIDPTPIALQEPRSVIDHVALFQNYPNPFNSSTIIKYQIPKAGMTELRIFNILGEQVYSHKGFPASAGEFSLTWEGTDNYGQELASGVYFYRIIHNGQFSRVKKIVVIR